MLLLRHFCICISLVISLAAEASNHELEQALVGSYQSENGADLTRLSFNSNGFATWIVAGSLKKEVCGDGCEHFIGSWEIEDDQFVLKPKFGLGSPDLYFEFSYELPKHGKQIPRSSEELGKLTLTRNGQVTVHTRKFSYCADIAPKCPSKSFCSLSFGGDLYGIPTASATCKPVPKPTF